MYKNNKEQSSTYFVLDQANKDELKRLRLLDHATTLGMGGVLPEQPDATLFQRVLDVGCGTGGWLIELAQALPSAALLIGLDANHAFIEYARARAAEVGVSARVEFHVADALRMLEFPTDYFDLVNHRFAWSWLRTWDWPKLLQEYLRVTCPEGVVRITEGAWSSPAPILTQLDALARQALYRAGHTFTEDAPGLIHDLTGLLDLHGLLGVQTRRHTLQYGMDTQAGREFCENIRLGYQTILPFVRKWVRVPDNYDELCQQLLAEMQQPDFTVTWDMLTAWGHVSSLP